MALTTAKQAMVDSYLNRIDEYDLKIHDDTRSMTSRAASLRRSNEYITKINEIYAEAGVNRTMKAIKTSDKFLNNLAMMESSEASSVYNNLRRIDQYTPRAYDPERDTKYRMQYVDRINASINEVNAIYGKYSLPTMKTAAPLSVDKPPATPQEMDVQNPRDDRGRRRFSRNAASNNMITGSQGLGRGAATKTTFLGAGRRGTAFTGSGGGMGGGKTFLGG